jgi:hypothetical protein
MINMSMNMMMMIIIIIMIDRRRRRRRRRSVLHVRCHVAAVISICSSYKLMVVVTCCHKTPPSPTRPVVVDTSQTPSRTRVFNVHLDVLKTHVVVAVTSVRRVSKVVMPLDQRCMRVRRVNVVVIVLVTVHVLTVVMCVL